MHFMSKYSLTQIDNQTLMCEESQVEFGSSLPFPDHISNLLRSMQIVYYIVCFLAGVFLNFIIILLIVCHKKLQNITFILSLQIMISNLLSATVFFPTSAANAVADRHVFINLCSIIGFAFFFMHNVRIYLMSGLVADRFFSIFLPFWYQRNRVRVVVLLSLGAWVLSFVIAFVPVRGLLDCYSFLRETRLGLAPQWKVAQTKWNAVSIATSLWLSPKLAMR